MMLDLKLMADHIADPALRDFTRRMLDEATPEFWTSPSSSSGKYHPEFDDGCGGLVRHTALMTLLAVDGLRRYTVDESGKPAAPERHVIDAVLCAGLLHDVCKNGHPKWGPHTVKEHPQLAANLMREAWHDDSDEPESPIALAAFAVEHHYGVWTRGGGYTPLDLNAVLGSGDNSPFSLPVICALVIQEGDYYASRRYLGAPVRSRMEEALDPLEVPGVNPVELP